MISRRKFLQVSSAAGLGSFMPYNFPSHLSAQGSNETIRLAVIGVGGIGQAMIRNIMNLPDTMNISLVAACDVWQRALQNVNRIARENGYDTSDVELTDDYRRILDRDDVDAVLVATPDFSHFQIASDTISAGKDMYLEKPMTYTMQEAADLRDMVNASDRVVQIGTMHASEPGYHAAADIIASGILGKISRVEIARNFNQQRWLLPFNDVRESEVNWELFLTGLSDRPFNARLLRQWKLFRDTCNGVAGIFLPHFISVLHIMMDVAHPVSAVSHGGVFVWDDGRENPDTFYTLLEYPEGFIVNFTMGLGNSAGEHFAIYGTEGTLDVLGWSVTPNGGNEQSSVTRQRILGYGTQVEGANPNSINLHAEHLVNWLDCVRTRSTPRSPVETGYNHMVASTLATDAYWSGQKTVFG